MNGYKFYLLAVPTNDSSETETSDKIQSRSSRKYTDNWDSIFSKKPAEKQDSSVN